MKLNLFQWPSALNSTQLNTAETKPLFFLHGLGGTGQIWRPIAAELENDFVCFAPDQRGHGLSRPVTSGGFTALDYANDVKELLHEKSIAGTILIGHSMGVRTALALTSLAPTLIKGVIAVDLGLSQQWGGGMGISLGQFIEKLPESFPTRETLRAYLTHNCPDPSIAQYLAAVSKEVESRWVFPFDHEALVQTIEVAHTATLKDWVLQASANSIPLLFLHGQNSKVWSGADYEKQKNELQSPLIQFESWENAGHGLPFEQRKKFVARVREFTRLF